MTAASGCGCGAARTTTRHPPGDPLPACQHRGGIAVESASATRTGGLSSVEAARRLQLRGKPSRRADSRSYRSIILANTLTIPNELLVVFGVLTLVFDSWKDALFLGIVLANIAIGCFQEIRSKRELDRLAALIAPQAVVVRDGADARVPV